MEKDSSEIDRLGKLSINQGIRNVCNKNEPEEEHTPQEYFENAIKANCSYSTAGAKIVNTLVYHELPCEWKWENILWEAKNNSCCTVFVNQKDVLKNAEAEFSRKLLLLNQSQTKYRFNMKEVSCRVLLDCVVFAALQLVDDASLDFELESKLEVASEVGSGMISGELDYYITDRNSVHFVIEAKQFSTFESSKAQLALQLQAVHVSKKPFMKKEDVQFMIKYPVWGLRSDGVRYQFLALRENKVYCSPVYRVKGIAISEAVDKTPEKSISELILMLAWILGDEYMRLYLSGGCQENEK